MPAEGLAWGLWFETTDERRVAWDEVNGVRISTVFLGIDHRFFGEGAPILFETMLFSANKDDGLNGRTRRYETWEQAEAGHRAIVDQLREGYEWMEEWDESVQ